MRLEELEALGSFALLGPGFSGGGFTLLTGLEPCGADEAQLLFAPYECRGEEAVCLRGERRELADFELPGPPAGLVSELEADGHAAAVGTIREAIAAGDVYQVCLTVRARLSGASGAGLFAALCARGVARFAAWIRLPDGTELASGSPELFFELEAGRVRSQPMKGTARPELEGELERSEKDQAELAMITDLVRNDLTPLCLPRSVRVTSERRFIRLPYAVQAVSEVEGTLRPGVGAIEVLAALHPGGSVTGAPKRSAMRMIDALEGSPRGPYCGALGLRTGELTRFALLIRTGFRDGEGWLFGVGGGIVWDSEADRELDEVRVKLEALGCATRR